ncbi:MAG: hypothetical protein D3923_16870 [Candidatus Electrothrix sp. AR3]|nr:hypothetical protein [Candidatus Electrothrix sp. AR3]
MNFSRSLDLDVEIKFILGGNAYSIDVDKNQIEKLKDLYKSLVKIASIQHENAAFFSYANDSIKTATNSVHRASSSGNLDDQFKEINKYSFAWMKQAYETYKRKDFGDIFDKFINN